MKQVLGQDLVADSLGSLFAFRVQQSPEEIGFRFEDQSYTYAQMKQMADRVRASLRRDGAQPGDRIAAFMHNSPWLLALFLATAMDRLVYCPINVLSRRDDLSYFLKDIEPFTVFVDESLVEVFQSGAPERLTSRRILLGNSAAASSSLSSFESWLEPNVGPVADAAIEPGDPLCIMYSGGTTGLPKGIVMPQFAPVGAALRINGVARFRERENFFTALQLSHAWTPLNVLPFCLYYGHVFCFWKWWSASHFVQWARRFDASIVDPFIGMIATLLQTPEKPDDRSLQSARLLGGLGGADPVAMRIRSEFEKRFGAKTFDLYGFTEITGLAAVETEHHARKAGSSGRLTGWYDVSVVDSDDVLLPAGETGELLVRPRVPHTVGLGYHRKPEVTVATWRNLWIHTGDLGYFDHEGYLFYVGRKNHFLRRRGELISAAEIESVIMNAPGIVEVAVTAAKSEFGEDEVRAFVVTRDENFNPQELVSYCRERIASFKVPRYIDVMDSLPRSGTKREIERFRLQARDLSLAWDAEWQGDDRRASGRKCS
jgi:crotonobetaine/carnitine-CoA ligase